MSSHDRACTGHGSLATHSQVINTAGLRNDYTFLSGLQAHEIRLGSPDRFPRERCGLGTRLVWVWLADLLMPKPVDLTEGGPARENFRVLLSQRTSSELFDSLIQLFPPRTTARPDNQSS